ncbi:hypothetical protein QIU18_00780 [Capnocytophaga canimorsus]|nr:hypothetical protein [Capnocytophaga canimorsus]WGU70711.1 hypothetical protein QIU18_00780 [Capnocytophaga canimorsus]
MSKVTVKSDDVFDYEIYMNHILNHKGHRLFQASFHPDEKGSVLSVNQDYWGDFIYLYRICIAVYRIDSLYVPWKVPIYKIRATTQRNTGKTYENFGFITIIFNPNMGTKFRFTSFFCLIKPKLIRYYKPPL